MKTNRIWGSGLSPFFAPEDFLPTHPTVKEDFQTEVLVIGGGLSGLLCAYELLKSGKGVTLVTANTVSDGASRFSTGMLCGDGGADLLRLRETIGQENAVAWYRLACSAVEQLEKILNDTGSKCDFRRRDVFYYTASPRQSNLLREEYLLRHHVGLESRWVTGDDCMEQFSFPCAGGMIMENLGCEMNSVKFCRDLADWITLHGGTVYEGSRVDVIEAGNGTGFTCICRGKRITAQKVIDARGGEVLQKRPQLGQRVTVFSVVTEPIAVFRGWPDQCLIKSADSFSFLRTTPDRRILYSGEASSALSPEGRIGSLDANALCRVKYKNLEAELKEMFIGIPRIKREYGFSQGLVLPKKGLPYVGQDSQWKGLYYLYAFGECGIAGVVVGSAWINRMICDPSVRAPEYLSL